MLENVFVFIMVFAFVYAAIIPPPTPAKVYRLAADGTLEEVEYETRTVTIPMLP